MHSSTIYKEDDERVSYFVGIIEKGKMPEVYMGEVRMLTEGWRRRHTLQYIQ